MRVLRVLTRPNLGGPARQAVALWHAHRALGVQTLLAVGGCRAGETPLDLAAAGIPPLVGASIDPHSAGFVVVPQLDNRVIGGGLWSARAALARLCRAFQPDVVHTHTSKAGLVGRIAARGSGAVLAHTFHGHVLRDYFGPLRSLLLRWCERALARRTELLFCVSDSCAEELAELGIAPRTRLIVVPPAVAVAPPMDRETVRRRLGVPQDAWLAAVIGRLVPIKRVDRFVAAVALLPGCRGHVYGSGPLQRRLVQQARGIAVEWLGPAVDAPQRLSGYDVLVLPGRREGLPLVAVEAFAAGVPVVGFEVPGVRDVIGIGGGLLVPEAAGAAGLAAAMRRLREDAALRAECIRRGRAALPVFAPEAVAAQLAAAYRSARSTPPC